MPGGRFVGEEGILEPRVRWLHDDARFRQVRAAREHNTLCTVYCVLYELDDDELMICSLWVSPRPFYRLGAC